MLNIEWSQPMFFVDLLNEEHFIIDNVVHKEYTKQGKVSARDTNSTIDFYINPYTIVRKVTYTYKEGEDWITMK